MLFGKLSIQITGVLLLLDEDEDEDEDGVGERIESMYVDVDAGLDVDNVIW